MAQEIRLDLVAKVDKALKDLEALKDGIDASAKATEEAAKATEEGTKATKSAAKATKLLSNGFKGVGLAMKAAGIGIALALFSKLKEVLEQNQTVMDLVSTAMNTISVVFNQVSDVVTDVYDSVTKSSEGFDALGKVLNGVMTISLLPIKAAFYGIKAGILALMIAWEDSFLGGGDETKIAELTQSLDDTKQSLIDIKDEGLEAVKNIGNNIAEAITEVVAATKIIVEEGQKGLKAIDIKSAFETGGELTKLRNEVKLLDADAKGLMLTYQTQAELQRQIRDDESATIAQRVAANDELGRILEEQLEQESNLAQKKVDLAQLESDLNADNIDLQIALKDAKTELIDINERIIGQESEQKTNQVALNKELLDSENELMLIGKTTRELELEELAQWYQQKIELARKAGADTTAIEQSYSDKRDAIDKKEQDQKIARAKANTMMNVQVMANGMGTISGLLKEGTAASKAAAIAELAINTGLGYVKGLGIAQAGALGTGPMAPYTMPIFYGSQVLAVLSAAAQAKKILGAGGGGVTPPSLPTPPSVGGNLAASIPAATGLGDVISTINAQGQAPLEAYVISQDVTDSQEAQSYINNQRTL